MTSHLPSVVIVGRPNVGKSTLFNRLTGTRRSIVTNEPGITRDRIYGTAEWNGRAFEVVDTGGIVPDDKALIPREIFRQAQVAIERAAQLVLVVDARAGATPLDEELARLLLRTGKPLAVAVNKVDAHSQAALAAEFAALGADVFPVSAEHGTGVDDLLDAITANFPEGAAAESPEVVRIAIIGRPNVGKSTLLNRLAGEERAIVSPEPGTTRDAVDTRLRRAGQDYLFVDTAGIRRKGKTKLVAEKLSVVMARKHLEQADVALLIVDSSQGVTSSDATIASYARDSGRSLIVVMNKWDLALKAAAERSAANEWKRGRGGKGNRGSKGGRGEDRMGRTSSSTSSAASTSVLDPQLLIRDYEAIVREKLKFIAYAPVIFLSALTGERTGKLFALIDRVAAARRRRVSTGEMNRWLERVDLERGTMPFGRQMKIYYITQAGVAPPTFVLFTNQSRPMHFSYERFLEKQLRAAFDFTGTPIQFLTRARNK
jgi:GTP-binding protein